MNFGDLLKGKSRASHDVPRKSTDAPVKDPIIYVEDPVKFTRPESFQKDIEEVHRIRQLAANRSTSLLDSHLELWEQIWYLGHIYIMTTSIISILMCITRQVHKRWPRLLYRSTFVSVVVTYGLSLMKDLNGSRPYFFSMLPLPTFQYLCVGTVWIFTVLHTIKLLPFAFLSLLHVADTASHHHENNLTRAKIAQDLSNRISPEVMRIVAYLDLWLCVELFWDAILIRPGAVVSLAFYGFIMQVKLMFSPLTQEAIHEVYTYADKYLSRPDMPTKLREFWIRLRNKCEPNEMRKSKLYMHDTDEAIEHHNLMGTV